MAGARAGARPLARRERRGWSATRTRSGGGGSGALGRAWLARAGGELGLRALGRDAHYVPREAEPAEREDQPPRGVELIPAQPVKRGLREGMVVVVPRLPQRGQRQPEDVRRMVVDVKAAPAEEVADGVDAPGDVVHEEYAHEPAPQQGAEAGGERAGAEREAEQEGHQQAGQRDQREETVDAAHDRIFEEVAREPFRGGLPVGLEQ